MVADHARPRDDEGRGEELDEEALAADAQVGGEEEMDREEGDEEEDEAQQQQGEPARGFEQSGGVRLGVVSAFAALSGGGARCREGLMQRVAPRRKVTRT